MPRFAHNLLLLAGLVLVVATATVTTANDEPAGRQRLLYVGSPGIKNYIRLGGHGVLVYDRDDNHRFVKRISLEGFGVDKEGIALNVKGVCASARTGRFYVSTLRHLICIDLVTDKVLWQKTFEFGCDRMSIAPDGKTIYVPSLETDYWYIVNAVTSEEIKRLEVNSRSHNTVYGEDGRRVYLSGLASPYVSVAKTNDHTIERTVGPFSDFVRPFTINGAETLLFANVNHLLGFEIGDLKTNKKTHRVEVKGFPLGKSKRHG
jgi:hypothetical protein